MKILMILDNGFYPDVRVYKEAQYLISKGCSVEIVCWDHVKDMKKPKNEIIDGIEITRYKIPCKKYNKIEYARAYVKYLFKVKEYLKKCSYDYLHVHDLSDAVIGFLCRKRNTPYIFDMHEYYESGMPRKYRLDHMLVEFLIKHSKVSLYENDIYLDSAYAAVKSKLIPLKNYPDKNIVHYVAKYPSDIFRVAYHGEVRNQLAEFEALFKAVQDLENVRVDINGGGKDLPYLEKIAAKYKNVFINGPYDGTNEKVMSDFYANTDVLYCGYDPQDPNMQYLAEIVKYYEALCTGTPIIATKNLAIGMRTEKYQYGIAVNTRKPEEIKSAIVKLMNDRSFWDECSKHELFNSTSFNWQAAVTVLDNIYSL